MRLFVAGYGEERQWCMAMKLSEAKEKLGPETRAADDDDCRFVYHSARMWAYTPERIKAELGCSRQTVDSWRRRAGRDAPTRTKETELQRSLKVRQAIAAGQASSVLELSEASGAHYRTAKKFAGREDMTFSKWKRRPSDEKLVELQKGRTWWELAEVTGLTLSTLRQYIYSRPELAKAMKAVRKPTPRGLERRGQLPLHKIREMHNNGVSVHKIAETLHVEQMAIRYWLRKWQREESAHDQTDEQGAPAGPVAGSGEGAGGE